MAHLLVSANPGIDLANEPRYTDFLRSLPDGSKKVFNNRGYTFDDWEKWYEDSWSSIFLLIGIIVMIVSYLDNRR